MFPAGIPACPAGAYTVKYDHKLVGSNQRDCFKELFFVTDVLADYSRLTARYGTIWYEKTRSRTVH